MSATKEPSLHAPREALAKRIDALGTKSAKSLAAFVRGDRDASGSPCWGAIAARFDALFEGDGDRLALLEALVAEGDRRALLVFLGQCRDRPKVLEALCACAERLPSAVQRALVAMPEAATVVAANLERFEPAAAEIWRGGESTKRPERELFEARLGALTAVPSFVRDTVDPRDEAAAKAAPATVRRIS